MLNSPFPSAEELPEASQTRAAERRGWLIVFRITLALALLLAVTACDQPPSGNANQQSAPATICNASLFQQARFSASQQDGKTLYAAYATDTTFTQTGVVALNASTHQQLWQRSFSVNTNAAMRLTAADGVVYALFQRTNTDWSWLYALDAQTGKQLWAYDEAGADDLLACNGVVALLGNWTLHVFASTTGKALWTYGLPAQNERLAQTLSMSKDTLYMMSISLVSEQATIHALNLQDGTTRWQMALPPSQEVGMVGSLTLTGQALYVLQAWLETPGNLIALRPQDGKQLWSASSADYENILMTSDQTLYLANPWQIDAYQTSNGKLLWSQRFSKMTNSAFGSAQLGLFITQEGDTFCSLDPNKGTASWCLNLALLEWAGTPFFIDSATIYLFSDGNHSQPDDNHNLYVVDRQTGKTRTHFTIHTLTGAITAL